MDIRVVDGLFRVGIGSALALGMGVSVLGTGGAIALAALVDAYAIGHFAPKPKAASEFEELDPDLGVQVMDEMPPQAKAIDKAQVEVIRMVAAGLVVTVAAVLISYVTGMVFLKVLGSLTISYNVARISRPLCAMALKGGETS